MESHKIGLQLETWNYTTHQLHDVVRTSTSPTLVLVSNHPAAVANFSHDQLDMWYPGMNQRSGIYWVVSTPLTNMKVSCDDEIPTEWKK